MSTITVNMEDVMEMESTMGKSTRKPSDMNAPKRPLSAFFLWANKTRPSVVAAHQGWGVADIAKELGIMWKSVSSSEVESYQAKYKKAKKEYDAKMGKYMKSANYEKFQIELLAYKIHQTKKPFKSDPNAPKRPLSAYMLYAASVRAKIIKENPNMSVNEVMTEQSVWWKGLDEIQRKPWNDKASAMRAKYEKQLAKYQETTDYQNYVAERDQYKLEMVAKRNKLMGIKSKKRARSRSGVSRSVKRARRSTSSRCARTPKRRSRRRATKDAKKRSRHAKSPKGSKRRSSSRSVSTSRRSSSKRRSRSARRARTPKAPKRSRSLSASTRASTSRSRRRSTRSSRRARTPKSSKRRSRRSRSRSNTSKAFSSASRRSRRSSSKKSRSRTPKRRRSSSRTSRRSRRRQTSESCSATPAAPASVVEVDTATEMST